MCLCIDLTGATDLGRSGNSLSSVGFQSVNPVLVSYMYGCRIDVIRRIIRHLSS